MKRIIGGIVITAFASTAWEADDCALIEKSMRAQVAASAYRITTTNVDPASDKVKSKTRAEARLPGRMHMFNEHSEQIVIQGKGTFDRDDGGSWKRSDYDLSDVLLASLDPKNFTDTATNCRKIGADTLDGKAMSVWAYDTKVFGVTSTTRMWVNSADGLPYKLQIDGKIGGMKTKSIQVIEYDPSISIAPPL